MGKPRTAIRNWAEYLALRTVASAMHCFDLRQNLGTADAVGSFYFRANPKRAARAERNLTLSFPDWPDDQIRSVAERSFQYMFRLFMVDAFVTPRLVTPATWQRYVRLGRVEPVLDRLVTGQPSIFISGHCGNWELLGFTLAVLGFPFPAVARPLDNPLINRWLMASRQARGLRILTKFGVMKELPELLKHNTSIGFVADQNAGDQGLFVPFFGRLASSYKSIGLLAIRYDVPIVAGVAHRISDDFEFRLDCTDVITPDDWTDQPDPLFYVTARYNLAMENMVRTHPDQYLWLHRRWKSRPKHEREGKPFPKRLRRKLEELPWMTQPELDRIVALSSDASHQEVGVR